MELLAIGEVLWDVFPDKERLGGAALNFCANLQRLGDRPTLLSAVGDDPRGTLILEKMRELDLSTRGTRQVDQWPTGIAMINGADSGDHSFTIPRPAAFDDVSVSSKIFQEVQHAKVDWLYFGTLMQTTKAVEDLTTRLASSSPHLRCFYDMNLREDHWNLGLVQRLSRLASILKVNELEAQILYNLTPHEGSNFSVEKFCNAWASAYEIELICVTLGPAGCTIYDRGSICSAPGYQVSVCDTVGAGDAFSAAFLHGYASGWPTLAIAQFANALGAIVASRAGATPQWSVRECYELMADAVTIEPS